MLLNIICCVFDANALLMQLHEWNKNNSFQENGELFPRREQKSQLLRVFFFLSRYYVTYFHNFAVLMKFQQEHYINLNDTTNFIISR